MKVSMILWLGLFGSAMAKRHHRKHHDGGYCTKPTKTGSHTETATESSTTYSPSSTVSPSSTISPSPSTSHGSCTPDECLAQLTSSRNGTPDASQRSEDCIRFMTSVLTPEPVTTETTVYPTLIVTVYPDAEPTETQTLARRATHSPSIPSYASSCVNTASYSSACACWGITPGVTTAPTPTVTNTVTSPVATSTVTAEPIACPTPGKCGTFVSGACDQGSCICARDAEGQSACVVVLGCADVAACENSSQCAEGERCMVNSCCPQSRHCAPVAPYQCLNENAPVRMFRRMRVAVRGGRECTSSGCPDGAE